jgi:drug/metabolite transporter (DMT)-like permease
MFPLVTALLAMVLLRERLNRVQMVGFFLAAAAIYLTGQAPGATAMEALHGFPMDALTTPWMFWTFSALVTYGVSAYLQKITTFYCSNELSTIVFALVWIPVAIAIYFLVPGFSFKLSTAGWVLSLLFGALIGIGSLLTFASYRWGKASVVTPIIGLYPALTVLLSVPLLREPMGTVRAIWVGLALAAGAALGCESNQPVRAVDEPRACAVGRPEKLNVI